MENFKLFKEDWIAAKQATLRWKNEWGISFVGEVSLENLKELKCSFEEAEKSG